MLARSVTVSAGVVVEQQPRFGARRTRAVEPAVDQPARMRQGDADRYARAASGGRRMPGGPADRSPRPRESWRSTALTKPAALGLPAARVSSTASSTTADAGTRSRWQQLIDAEPQDVDDPGSSRRAAAGERVEIAIDRGAPAQRAGRDFGCSSARSRSSRQRRARGRAPPARSARSRPRPRTSRTPRVARARSCAVETAQALAPET